MQPVMVNTHKQSCVNVSICIPTVLVRFVYDYKFIKYKPGRQGFLQRYIKRIEYILKGAHEKQQPNAESLCDDVVSSLLHDGCPGTIKQTVCYQQL